MEEFSTNIEWLGPYKMEIVDKTKKNKKPQGLKRVKAHVKLSEGDYEIFEALKGELKFFVSEAMLYVYQVETGCPDLLVGIVNEGWVSVTYV